jgi:hypothetical protein
MPRAPLGAPQRAGVRLLRRLCTPLPPGTYVWRYLDFAKFVGLLDARALFFAPLSALGDPYEGAFAPANLTDRMRHAALLTGPANERFLRNGILRHMDRTVVVNCWHIGRHESVALWRQYAASNASVCVQSTYSRLKRCLPDVDIGQVQYIDYARQPVPETAIPLPLLHKRLAFSHERELRAFMLLSMRPYQAMRKAPRGFLRAVDLQVLIQRLYVAPTSPTWIKELVRAVATRYGLRVPVLQSALDEPPLRPADERDAGDRAFRGR